MNNNSSNWILGSDFGVFSLNRMVTVHKDKLVSDNFFNQLELAKDDKEYLSNIEHSLAHYFKVYWSTMQIIIEEERRGEYDDTDKDLLMKYGNNLVETIPYLIELYSENKEMVDSLKNLSVRIIDMTRNSHTLELRKLYNTRGIINSILKCLRDNDVLPHTLLNNYNKIVSSSSFRRLQDKAQVFPLEEHDYARTRLTHTMEVASIACEITDIIARIKPWDGFDKRYSKHVPQRETGVLLEKTVENASLMHDMGNPPYGHYGEQVIRDYFMKEWDRLDTTIEGKKVKINKVICKEGQMYYDFAAFDGNAQSLRVMTKLQRYRKGHPLELSAGVLGALIKYPFNSVEGSKKCKMGYFFSEKDVIKKLSLFGTFRENYRNPCSLILEAADDISYTISDLDDAVKKGIINKERFEIEIDKINNKDDPVLLKFKNDYLYYVKESVTNNVEDPFAYTLSLMTYELKRRLIRQTANAFCRNYERIMDGIPYMGDEGGLEQNKDLLDNDCVKDRVIKKWVDNLFKKYLYNHVDILKEEVKGRAIIKTLLDEFTTSILAMDFNLDKNEDGIVPHYDERTQKHEYKVFSLISKNYIENFYQEYICADNDAERVYYKMKLAVDYVSGMTDSYAMECYHILVGTK